MEKKRILIAVHSLSDGGAEHVSTRLALDLSERGHDIHLCTLIAPNQFQLPCMISVSSLQKKGFSSWPQVISRYSQLLKKVQPDVVISMTSHLAILQGFSLLFQKKNFKWLARFASNYQRSGGMLPLFIEKKLLAGADYYISNSSDSQSALQQLLNADKTKFITIKNILDIDQLYQQGKQLAALEGLAHKAMPRIGFFGRLHPVKQLDKLLEIYRELQKSLPCELIICGQGKLAPQIRHFVEKHNLTNVKLMGYLQNPYPIMQSCDVCVLTSQHESSPNCLIEAQALGIPCVAYDCDFGPREILRHNETGYLIKPDDTKDFIEKIRSILSDTELQSRLGAAASEHIKHEFKREEISSNWEKIF